MVAEWLIHFKLKIKVQQDSSIRDAASSSHGNSETLASSHFGSNLVTKSANERERDETRYKRDIDARVHSLSSRLARSRCSSRGSANDKIPAPRVHSPPRPCAFLAGKQPTQARVAYYVSSAILVTLSLLGCNVLVPFAIGIESSLVPRGSHVFLGG